MCTTIYLTVPAGADRAPISETLRARGYHFAVVGQGDGELVLSLLSAYGACQCGTPLGSGARPREWSTSEFERNVARFRKRGWSEAKIERWLDDKHAAHTKEERISHDRSEGPAAANVESWLMLIRELSARLERFGVLVTDGEPWWENIGRRHVPVRQVDAVALRQMERGRLHVFVS
jgi:hypothetical protein